MAKADRSLDPALKDINRKRRVGNPRGSVITGDLQARVWVLREEGKSYREITAETGARPQTIAKILHGDPSRHTALIIQWREERSSLWKQIETESLKGALQLVRAALGEFFDATGKIKKNRARGFLRAGARWAAVLRQSANDATTKINLLTGGPTERMEFANAGEEPGTDDAAIQMALQLGEQGLNLLPPQLRARAEAARQQKIGGGPAQ